MLNIYLARHGQDEDNAKGILNGHRDMPLTLLGQKQAEELSQKIKDSGLSFIKIYSSPLQRAYATAQKISKKLNLPDPEIMGDLIERDFGIMTGELIENVEKMCAPDILQAEIITYFLSPDGAETFPILKERGQKILQQIFEKHKSGNILLVAHGDIGKMIYSAYYDLDWQEVLFKFHFGNSELLLLSKDSDPADSHVFNTPQFNH